MGKGDLFSDEDEVTNIFDEEKEEEDEDYGVEPETTEELDLATLGIVPKRFNGFKKRYPKKNIFYGGKITKNAFKWYIANCSMKELESIIEENLPEGFDELLAKKFSEEIVKNLQEEEKEEEESNNLSEKEKKIISGYIDQAAKLRKQIETQKETINKILSRSEDYFTDMAFLYNFMGDNMEIKDGVSVSDEDMERIDTIDERLNL